jgi:exopolyphosphatase/guanosine-5'-triphosphate,3'-diphosphate pyrophosphatase
MKLAVIDLGTNTCNLLIAEVKDKNYQLIYQGKVGVKLGKGGINKQLLTPEAFVRATNALNEHRQTIEKYEVDKVFAIATSAVREAANRKEFETHLLKETTIKLVTISGDQEAQLIFEGVKLAFGKLEKQSLIMDIGGGSNEFIETNNDQIVWKESFPLGMARIIEQIPLSDPITAEEISTVEKYFDQGLELLWKNVQPGKLQLIGCSGAFDTIADLIDQSSPGTKIRQQQEISLNDFNRIADQVIFSTKEQREQMKGMDPLRVEMIVPALIFIRLVVEKLEIEKITQTDFALREGILYKWIYD